ncbi:ARS binding protein Abp2 [Aspergillus sp. HF37]|nr:ARS binding protein Abp2 [Aspergillus sp. HF37]
MNQCDRDDLGGFQVIAQPYARYPTTVEPALPSTSSTGSARSRGAASISPPLPRKETPRSLQSSPGAPRSAIPVAAARSGQSMSPPPTGDLTGQAESRCLPSRDLTDETIDNAYIAFILYCNPSVPPSANTCELRKCFRCPPRSDGKNFSIFTLWQLIQRLDCKELKTWIQLSIELGVERPSPEKRQSTQKIQQYAVRLKRWMRAMHVDAFFEYCLGHSHPYYTQLPQSNASVSEGRDGVPLEEDLALRALVPEWKPKRGRKRTEGSYGDGLPSKRPQLDTSEGTPQPAASAAHSAVFPQSAIPFSAFPDDMASNDPWIAATSSFGADSSSDAATVHQNQEFRWRPLERDTSPAGYPQSAIIPRRHRSSDVLPSTEPKSAVTPSTGEKPRSRRRHGPAVSSAWLSNSGSSNGKTRGRPPQKDSASGPFSSFPVNPNHNQSDRRPVAKSPPRIVLDDDSTYHQSPTPNARPGKLQLQVPQHQGAPVRLATPPTLLVNGNDTDRNTDAPNGHSISTGADQVSQVDGDNHTYADPASDDLIQILATELLAGKVVGRQNPLSSGEARTLASSMVTALVDLYSKSPLGLPVLMAALHLGKGHHFGFAKVASGPATVNVNVDPAANIEGSALPGDNPQNPPYTIFYEYGHSPGISTKMTFSDIRIEGDGIKSNDTTAKLDNDMKELDDTADAEFETDYPEDDVPDANWKQRYVKLRAQLQKKQRAMSQYKRKIMESVMADI